MSEVRKVAEEFNLCYCSAQETLTSKLELKCLCARWILTNKLELKCICARWVPCLFVLRFYSPVNPMGSCRARSVYLTTRLLGRLSPLSG